MIDWDKDKGYGTLKEYTSGQSAKIADDVHSYTYTPNGKVLYLYDYSLKYYSGELHLWENGTSRKLDDDVVFLVPTTAMNAQIQNLLLQSTKSSFSNSSKATAPAAAR